MQDGTAEGFVGSLAAFGVEVGVPAARPAGEVEQNQPGSLLERRRAVRIARVGQQQGQEYVRHAANGRRAHHRCSADGCPCRMDFSRAECKETFAIGTSTSAKTLHSLGIISGYTECLPISPSRVLKKSETRS